MTRLCLVAFLHSPFSRPGPSPSPGPLRVRAEALRGLRSPAPSPAALNKNLIKCRGRLPPGLGRPDHRAGFLLQTAQLGLGRPCACMERAVKPPYAAHPAASPRGLRLASSPYHRPASLSTPALVLSPHCSSCLIPFISLSFQLLFLFSSQPGRVSVSFCLGLLIICCSAPCSFLGSVFPSQPWKPACFPLSSSAPSPSCCPRGVPS